MTRALSDWQSLDVRVLWIDGVTLYELRQTVVLAGYRVPIGYRYDGPSIPRPIWPLLPRTDKYLISAAVHDHALEHGTPWAEANALMRQAMRQSGVTPWRRKVIAAGIEIGRAWDYAKALFGRGRYV